MKIILRLDAGDMLLKHETPIGPAETAEDLFHRLAPLGADLLIETLKGLEDSSLTPQPQSADQVTFAPILKREDGEVDWNLTAPEIYNRLRGFEPWPGIHTYFRGRRLRIHQALPLCEAVTPPGTVSASDGQLHVGCGGASALAVEEVQPEGKKRMAASDFVRGYRPEEGETLGKSKK